MLFLYVCSLLLFYVSKNSLLKETTYNHDTFTNTKVMIENGVQETQDKNPENLQPQLNHTMFR
jgi:hypothetical protein